MKLIAKLPARYLSIHKRHWALSSQSQIRLRKIGKVITAVGNSVLNLQVTSKLKPFMVVGLMFILFISYINILCGNNDDELALLNMIDKKRTIASFSKSDCWNFFETKQADLYRL
jgi:hypothetical protein